MVNRVKDRKVAAVLAFVGILLPGLHKFYLGQPRWGVAYLLLSWTPIPKIASALEGFWYLFQDREDFARHFNAGLLETASGGQTIPNQAMPAPLEVSSIAEALRQIEQLRQEGLISEHEFEQKRRQLVERIG
jgi:TM2 domain-containing membrane protein YozV